MKLAEQLQRLRAELAGPINDSIRAFKDSGRPVIGYFCSYVPVELVTAAGMLPVRLRGAGSTDSGAADVFMSSRTCTYVRHVLALALEGELDFLDGQISLNTCDHVRRAHDVWRHKSKVGFHGFLSVPRNVRPTLYPYFREEVDRLRDALERHFGCQVTDEALREAITAHNQVRARLQRIDCLRAGERPLLSGADMLAVTVASTVMAPADFVRLADRLIEALEQAPPPPRPPRARLLLAGAELDEPDFVDALESQGAVAVADSLCFGMRPSAALVDEDAADPLDAVCRRVFSQVPCARMIGNFPERFEALLGTVRERRVDGVVFQRLMFCDPWGGEAHNLRRRLKRHDLPLLVIEREYGQVHAGQVRTRVQAFMELIESRARRAAPQEGA